MTTTRDRDGAFAPRRWLAPVADAFALAGGLVVTAAILVTVVSVVAARLGRPILGVNEVVELSSGVAIACFLPYCQLRGANVIVDFFTLRAPVGMKAFLDAAMSGLFALVVAVLAWRLVVGGLDAHARERVSMFLALPQWWGYALAAVAMVLWALVCAATALEAALSLRPAKADRAATDEAA